MMRVLQLDHIVLTVRDIDIAADFYCRVLGMERIAFGQGRIALEFGQQKINLHPYGNEFQPHADRPQPGSADLCFVVDRPIPEIVTHLTTCGIDILVGPVERTGALGPIISVYIRDPDRNLVELCRYRQPTEPPP